LIGFTPSVATPSIFVVSSGCNSSVRCGVTNVACGCFSAALGGQCNTANGNYSSILGGVCNNTCNFADTFIVGSNICATQACTTFTNCVAASNLTTGCYTCVAANGVIVNAVPPPITTAKICTIPLIGINIVDTTPKLGYNAAFYNFTISDCVNSYSGTLTVNWNGTTDEISWNETSTTPIGSILPPTYLVDNSGNFIVDNNGNFIVVTDGIYLAFEIVSNDVNLIFYTDSVDWKISFSKIVLEDCCTSPI
jgi:hypothetical protein